MITSWRAYFGRPAAFFGIVVLEPWVGGPAPRFRNVQYESVAALPMVGYALASDIGDPLGPFGSVHPRHKAVVGSRLAAAALTLQFQKPTPYLAPMYQSARASAAGTAVTVTVTLSNVPTSLVPAADHCRTEIGVPANQCFWFSILASDGKSYNATASVGADGRSLVLAATVAASGTTALATSFGDGQWPINTVVSAEGIPIFPWPMTNVTAAIAA